ncbi:Cadherin-like, partial [Trinorchestia longiramus]
LAAAALATVIINITDVNDVPPKFLQQEYDATIWRPTQTGVLVAELSATDDDFNNKTPLQYAIVDGDDERTFVINPNSGLVTVADASKLRAFYKLKV